MTAHSFTMPMAFSKSTYRMQCHQPYSMLRKVMYAQSVSQRQWYMASRAYWSHTEGSAHPWSEGSSADGDHNRQVHQRPHGDADLRQCSADSAGDQTLNRRPGQINDRQ